MDRNPLNGAVSAKDILVETGAGLVFGGVKSTVPRADPILDLLPPDPTPARALHVTDVGKSVWSDTVLATEGDGAPWPATGRQP